MFSSFTVGKEVSWCLALSLSFGLGVEKLVTSLLLFGESFGSGYKLGTVVFSTLEVRPCEVTTCPPTRLPAMVAQGSFISLHGGSVGFSKMLVA